MLELGNITEALRGLDEDERGSELMNTPGGMQSMSIINEPGLYSLILRSRKSQAKIFKRWITHEVIPTIRKTGSYSLSKPQLPDFNNPVIAARAWADEVEKKLVLQAKITEDKPYTALGYALTPDQKETSVGQMATILSQSLGYKVSRDGFSFLAMGFTGKKTTEFKLKYIVAFNAYSGL
ncbi:MAG: BRO family protein [Cloacibacillus sp.]